MQLVSIVAETGRVSRVSGSAPMPHKLVHGTKDKLDETESIRPMYREKFSAWSMSFAFAKAA